MHGLIKCRNILLVIGLVAFQKIAQHGKIIKTSFSDDNTHSNCLQPLFNQVCKDLRANIYHIVGISIGGLVGIVLLGLAAVFIIFAVQVTSAGIKRI